MGKFKRVRRLPALVVAFSLVALAMAAIAVADNLLADGDGLTTNGINGDNSTLAFGTVSCDQPTSKDVVIAVNRNGSGTNVYKDGSLVTVSAADDAAAVSTSLPATTITLPSNWGSLANNTRSSPVTATVTVHPTTAGTGSATVTFTGSGVNSSNASLARSDTVAVSWNVASCDTTAPTSSATAKNADNSDYTFGTWTNQNVTVTLSGQDNAGGAGLKEIRYTTDGSAPSASHGTVYGSAFPISAEGTTALKWLAIDNAGNVEALHSETVMIDKTLPTITDEGPTAAPNGDNGWYTTNVTNQFKAVDGGGSGLSATCDAAFDQPGDIKDVVISSEGSAQKGSSGSCTDNAGNVAPSIDSAAFKIDKTLPTSSGSAENADSSAYTFGDWTNQNVTVTLSGDDAAGGSGLREIRYTTDGSAPTASHGTVYTSAFPVSAEGTTTVKWRAIDDAGNLEAVHSELVMIDKTAPTITDEGPTAAPNGDNGWYTTNVTNQFKAVDGGGSGLSATCDAAFDQPGDIRNVVISDEGSAVTGSSGPCSDVAGNTAPSIDSTAFKIDKTAPAVSVTGVTHGASYTVGSVPSAGCSTTDAPSGVQTAATLSSSGGPVGSTTATCSGAKDNAGNTAAPVSATYKVLFAFDGFYQPIDNNGVFNKAKAGSAIPVKFSLDGAPVPGSNTPGLGGATSAFVPGTTTTPNPAVALVACPSSIALIDAIEELSADSVSGLKYDPSADQWIYVWKTTTNLANSCRQLKVTLADGTVRTANFQFTK